VRNGAIVLDAPLQIKDGTAVAIEIVTTPKAESVSSTQERYESYKPFIGALDDMPQDWAEKTDTYLKKTIVE
jgi:hypothetical protein